VGKRETNGLKAWTTLAIGVAVECSDAHRTWLTLRLSDDTADAKAAGNNAALRAAVGTGLDYLGARRRRGVQ